MAEIKIEWLQDSGECEDCGPSYAEGARVFVDGALALDLRPVARCYDGLAWSREEVFAALLERLGHRLEILEGEG